MIPEAITFSDHMAEEPKENTIYSYSKLVISNYVEYSRLTIIVCTTINYHLSLSFFFNLIWL